MAAHDVRGGDWSRFGAYYLASHAPWRPISLNFSRLALAAMVVLHPVMNTEVPTLIGGYAQPEATSALACSLAHSLLTFIIIGWIRGPSFGESSLIESSPLPKF